MVAVAVATTALGGNMDGGGDGISGDAARDDGSDNMLFMHVIT